MEENGVPNPATATAANTLPGVTARLAGIAGEFTIGLLVVRGLTQPVNLGQHFLGHHWCSLDFATGRTQLGVWGQSVQLVGRLASRPPGAKEGGRPGGVEGSPPPGGRASRCEPPPPLTIGLAPPRRRGELCQLEGYGRAKVLVYGLFAAASGLGASAAAGGGAGGRAGITGGDGSGLH